MSLRRAVLSVAVATASVTGVTMGVVGPAESAPAVRFATVQYDQPGNDLPVTSYKLNGEWVQVKNTTRRPKLLAGWKIKDNTGFTFVFPSGYRLGAGKTVTVHTGKGMNGAGHLYWKQGNYVWNNTGDKARLLTPAGQAVDSCSWGDGSGRTSC